MFIDFPIQTSIYDGFSSQTPARHWRIPYPRLPPRRQHIEPATVCHTQLKVFHAKLIGLESVEALVEPQKSNVFVYIYIV